METAATPPSVQNRRRYSLRALRPLFLWLIFVLLLYAIRSHQRAMERTRITFKVSLAGQPVAFGANATLDGTPISTGERISLGSHTFAPPFGSVHISSSHSNTAFSLTGKNSVFLNGESPAAVSELPAGEYELTAGRLGERQRRSLFVVRNQTNHVLVEFKYGAVRLETDPTGATVLDSTGRSLGNTPLTVRDLRLGTWNFRLEREEYESVPLILEVTGNQTNLVRTNLDIQCRRD
jgi:hypothetical protein